MGLFNKSTHVKFVDGIDLFNKDEIVCLSVDKEGLSIKGKYSNKKAYLKHDKITKADCITEKDIIEKSKSVAGRAMVGHLLLGPLGAIVGGMSGIGNKQKTVTRYYIVINYISNEEENALSFEVTNTSTGWDKVIKEIRQHIKVNSNIEL